MKTMTNKEKAKKISEKYEDWWALEAPNVKKAVYDSVMEMAKWKDKHPREGLWDAEKVIEWIKNNFSCSGYGFPLRYHHTSYQPEDIVRDLQKAMEDSK